MSAWTMNTQSGTGPIFIPLRTLGRGFVIERSRVWFSLSLDKFRGQRGGVVASWSGHRLDG